MRLLNLINEITFFTYSTMIRVGYRDISVQDLAALIRAATGVTIVTMGSHDDYSATFEVKLVSTKDAKTAYLQLRQNLLKTVPEIKKVEINFKGIEKLK